MNSATITQTNDLNRSAMIHKQSLSIQGLQLQEVSYPNRIMDIGRFRIKAWRNEKGVNPIFFSKDVWIDKVDQHAYHWIITKNEEIVASARLSIHESLVDVPYAELLNTEHVKPFQNCCLASINRLVVLPEYRGLGLSSLLDKTRIERAIQQKAALMIAFPQLIRLDSLKRKGFELVGQLENIPEMPERPFFLMLKKLNSLES
jgi:GNAT superfamily N-acetyltransferase